MKLKYKVGERVKTDYGILKVIGYEFVKSRGIRYILIRLDTNGAVLWDYMSDFEIKMIQK